MDAELRERILAIVPDNTLTVIACDGQARCAMKSRGMTAVQMARCIAYARAMLDRLRDSTAEHMNRDGQPAEAAAFLCECARIPTIDESSQMIREVRS